MKSSLTIVLGICLPLIIMMVFWQYLSSAPAPVRNTKPATSQRTPPRPPKGEPGTLKRFATPSQTPVKTEPQGTAAWSEAVEGWIDQAEQAARNNPDVQRQAASLLLQQRQFDSAAQAFDRLLMRDANDPVLLTGKAMALSGMDRHEDALPLFENAIRLDAGNPTTHFNYAVALMRSGERNKAADALQRVVQLQANHVRGWFNLAVLYQASGKPAESLEIWRKLTDGDPTSQPAETAGSSSPPSLAAQMNRQMLTDAWSHRGETALDSKNAAEAEMAFLNVVRIEPRNAAAWCNVGIARAEQVRRNDALTALHIALELDPNLVPALNQAAYIHAAIFRDSGDVDHGRRVVECCRQSLKVKPDQPNVAELLRAARYFDRSEQEAAAKEAQKKD